MAKTTKLLTQDIINQIYSPNLHSVEAFLSLSPSDLKCLKFRPRSLPIHPCSSLSCKDGYWSLPTITLTSFNWSLPKHCVSLPPSVPLFVYIHVSLRVTPPAPPQSDCFVTTWPWLRQKKQVADVLLYRSDLVANYAFTPPSNCPVRHHRLTLLFAMLIASTFTHPEMNVLKAAEATNRNSPVLGLSVWSEMKGRSSFVLHGGVA